MKSVSQRLPAALMIGILSVAGCGSGRVVLPFTLDSSTLTVSQAPRDFATTEDAIRGISALLVRDLGLPLPRTFTAYVYSDRHGFERGLIDDANVAPVRAAELSEFAVGIGKRRQLLLNDESGTAPPAGLPDGRLPDRAGRLPACRELLPHVRAQAGPPRQLPRDLRAEPRAVRAGSARPPQERRSLGAYKVRGSPLGPLRHLPIRVAPAHRSSRGPELSV